MKQVKHVVVVGVVIGLLFAMYLANHNDRLERENDDSATTVLDTAVTFQKSITLYSSVGGAFIFASMDHAESFQELNNLKLSKRCNCIYRGEVVTITEEQLDSLQQSREIIWCESKPHLKLLQEVAQGKSLFLEGEVSSEQTHQVLSCDQRPGSGQHSQGVITIHPSTRERV